MACPWNIAVEIVGLETTRELPQSDVGGTRSGRQGHCQGPLTKRKAEGKDGRQSVKPCLVESEGGF
jgi:hypothetical protein